MSGFFHPPAWIDEVLGTKENLLHLGMFGVCAWIAI